MKERDWSEFIKQSKQREQELVMKLSLKLLESAKDFLSNFKILADYYALDVSFCSLEETINRFKDEQKKNNWTDEELELRWQRHVALNRMRILEDQLKKED